MPISGNLTMFCIFTLRSPSLIGEQNLRSYSLPNSYTAFKTELQLLLLTTDLFLTNTDESENKENG